MTITYELNLESFEAWSGGKDTLEIIINEGKCEDLEAILEDLYPDGMTETQLNDLLWFESESIFEWIGIRTEEQIKNELEELEEQLEDLIEDMYEQLTDEDLTNEERKDIIDSYKNNIEPLKEQIKDLEEEMENL